MNKAAFIKALSNKKLEEVAEMLEQTGLKLSRQSFYQRTRTKKDNLFNNEQWLKFVGLINNPSPEFAELAINFRNAKEFLDSILNDNTSSGVDEPIDFEDDQFELDLNEDIADIGTDDIIELDSDVPPSDDLDDDLDFDLGDDVLSSDDIIIDEDDISLEDAADEANEEKEKSKEKVVKEPDEIDAMINSQSEDSDEGLGSDLSVDDFEDDDLDIGM